MKIALISPYFPKHFGGGEKYLLDTAKILAEKGHEVLIAVSQTEKLNAEKKNEIKKNYENFLDYSLDNIDFIASPLGTNSSFLKKLLIPLSIKSTFRIPEIHKNVVMLLPFL